MRQQDKPMWHAIFALIPTPTSLARLPPTPAPARIFSDVPLWYFAIVLDPVRIFRTLPWFTFLSCLECRGVARADQRRASYPPPLFANPPVVVVVSHGSHQVRAWQLTGGEEGRQRAATTGAHPPGSTQPFYQLAYSFFHAVSTGRSTSATQPTGHIARASNATTFHRNAVVTIRYSRNIWRQRRDLLQTILCKNPYHMVLRAAIVNEAERVHEPKPIVFYSLFIVLAMPTHTRSGAVQAPAGMDEGMLNASNIMVARDESDGPEGNPDNAPVNQVRSGPVASAAAVNVSHANSPPQVRLDGCQILYFEASPTSDVMQGIRCWRAGYGASSCMDRRTKTKYVWLGVFRKSMRDNQTPQDFLLEVESAVYLGARDYPLKMGEPSCLVRRVFLSGLPPYLSDFLVACDDPTLCDIAAKANTPVLGRAARTPVREPRRPLPVAAAADAVFGGQDAPVNKPYCAYHWLLGGVRPKLS
ncbi:hypothetical protein C7M84_006281 [Penaeus vannamei]|uniref:Uncharacterized protein n=1 Tax=Penaeus vannamei TaxID=6689 RepID=A0A3R7MFT1_PENVA|nr:hypothetical protein C7M84_006281 [Penaeus vannamei]